MESCKLCYENAGNLPLLELLPQTGGRLLDLGCGAGGNARILKYRGWIVTGITISPREQQIASAYCEECYLCDLNAGIPETVKGKYDVVLMSHILEHLMHPGRLLEDAKKVLVPNGLIAVALPNVLAYPNRLRFVFGKFEYTSGGIMDNTHIRFFTFASGRCLLEENGFKVIIARGDGAFPLWKIRSILPAIFVKQLNSLVCKYFPGIFASQSLFLANSSK